MSKKISVGDPFRWRLFLVIVDVILYYSATYKKEMYKILLRVHDVYVNFV